MEKCPKKFMKELQNVIRLKHDSYSTEKTYILNGGGRGVHSPLDLSKIYHARLHVVNCRYSTESIKPLPKE